MLAANLVGCKSNEWPPVPEPPVAQSPVIWKKGLERSGLTSTPLHYQDNILFGHHAKETNNYLVYCLNAKTVDSVWQTRIVTPFEFNPFDGQMSFLSNDKLVLSDSKRMFVLNAMSGEILWNYTDPNNFGGVCIIDNNIYIAEAVLRETSTMYRFDINTGVKEKLFTINRSEYGSNYSPDVLMPVKWVHPSGDEILVLQNRTYGWFTDMESKMDILAWNLTADSMLWYRDRLDGFSSQARPAIDGDKVYFYGDHHTYCINPATGETIWKYFIGNGPEDDFNIANILIIEDKVIIKPDNEHIHAVNKETGERIWVNEKTEASPGLLTVHKDTIWFASAGIFGINANTGEKVIDDWNNGGYGSWIFPVAHHPTNGTIFTSDATGFYCLNPKYMK